MTSSDPRYTPNPNRAIYVQGVIDQELVYSLTPQIVTLQSQSREPITVYIDSPGGIVTYMESLLNLLTVSNQQYDQPCHLVTVVTSQAASAAADLLASGDYALAYPESTILYHGVRIPGERALTVEETLQLAQRLKAGNDSFAMKLAREAEFRALFRFISIKDKFAEVRGKHPDKKLSDLQCLLIFISEHLSESAKEVLRKALERYDRYNSLLLHVVKSVKPPAKYKSRAAAEAAQIKAIVEFELRNNKKDKDWRFQTDGIHRVTDDFFLFHEYLKMFQSKRFVKLCQLFGNFFIGAEELQDINKLPEEERTQKIAEKVRPQLQPVWSFFVALCHILQQGENQLTGVDAFWLGLIDEVVGIQDLPSFRLMIEFAQQQKAQAEKDAASSAETATTTEETDSEHEPGAAPS